MDVQRRKLARWHWWLLAILVLGLALRSQHVHSPIIDHPGWRQGDEAAIARNFATLQYNPLYPQTDYNGPPPNYVELELQIVPFLAATLYKIFGVHEIFGRLISICFSLGTIGMIAYFARWLFASELAGLCAAFLFAIMPGSLYYGRTFTPDTTMVFFLTAALYAGSRYLLDDESLSWRGWAAAAALLSAALLAKPVAVVGLIPLACVAVQRAIASFRGSQQGGGALKAALLFIVPLLILFTYDHFESSIAEWHWASGITKLHVLPSLHAALTSSGAFVEKWQYFREVLGMLAHTMLGPFCTALFILGFLFPIRARSRSLLWGWLIAGLLYTYVVVTVERVDYYMYPLLPLAALAGASFCVRVAQKVQQAGLPKIVRTVAIAAAGVLAIVVIFANRREVAPYYRYSAAVYRNAVTLNNTLVPGVLIVMGHYDPSVLYYINRKGWEEDPYLWTPFDEQSAIRKGARYFVAIERNRFEKNVELYNWMQRFPVMNPDAKWPVYETDPAKVLPGAEQRWRKFRAAEKAGHASEFIPKH